MPEVLVGISLGSNMGDRDAELQAGISFLRELSVDGTNPRIAPLRDRPGRLHRLARPRS